MHHSKPYTSLEPKRGFEASLMPHHMTVLSKCALSMPTRLECVVAKEVAKTVNNYVMHAARDCYMPSII